MIKMIQTQENERMLELATGNKVYLRREDPFGFWYFSYDKGKVPPQLGGAFTTVSLAERSLNQYVESGAIEAGPKVEPPELKTKSVGPKAAAKAQERKDQGFGAASNAP